MSNSVLFGLLGATRVLATFVHANEHVGGACPLDAVHLVMADETLRKSLTGLSDVFPDILTLLDSYRTWVRAGTHLAERQKELSDPRVRSCPATSLQSRHARPQ